jgi:hypothetical protein
MPITVMRPGNSRAIAFQSGQTPVGTSLLPRAQLTATNNRPAQIAPAIGSSSQLIASSGSSARVPLNRMGR